MDKKTLIELAANSKMLKGLSVKLCNYRDIHNDLFQEFLLYLLEKPDQFLIDKYNDIQFISYCSNCLKGLNSNRLRDNKAVNSKNPLIERHNHFDIDLIDIKDEDYNFENDIKLSKAIRFIKDAEWCEILVKSMDVSLKQISIDTGLTYKQITYKNQQAKEFVRKNIS